MAPQTTWQILVAAFPRLLSYGIRVTIPLAFLSFALGLVIAVIVAMIQYADVKGLRQLCRFYIWLIRGTPLLVQLYVVFYGLPSVGIMIDAFPAAVFVFAFNEGAYMAETMRGALESVSRGQMEAGYCVGLSYLQIMFHIVLPQAFRTAFPALSNSLISVVKGTSLAATITVMEMFRQAQVINGVYYRSLGLYAETAVIYLAFCTVITWLQHKGEKRLSAYGGNR
ncbi:MAG: amino acid ABC transporter permease [Firmicutes bacterium]|nr:amino acid ABC transporter permease [Bacillota bacterium]MBQ5437384.1 amino acid ABC transporter permease [Bacillota bacterium]MBQ6012860.1 amino acid ABC transporter permease [Bacillota bacterium]MBQ6261633.1 amino acid ABC transporter permease [Bacillota bacterium]MBR0440998.1 amino acid ABC transporter permease [Bacillota bacterium]